MAHENSGVARKDPSRTNDFRNYVPTGDKNPHTANFDMTNVYIYSRQILSTEPVKSLGTAWRERAKEPFYGITNDGVKRENLFSLRDEGAPTSLVVKAATELLSSLSDEERSKVMCDLDDDKCRKWCNPEFILFEHGVRVEHLTQHQRDLMMYLLRSSLSEEGYRKFVGALKTNAFLGKLCNARAIMNEGSYFFLISGSPSLSEPWGFTFFGHHLCLNFFFLDKQMVISPCFIGAEPNIIDEGPDKGLEICVREEASGLKLMQSLPPKLQDKAQIYKELHDDSMPPGRWNFADQRHLGGAFRDNQMIPYEGILASELSADLQDCLLRVVESYMEILPLPVRNARLKDVHRHLNETYFSWIGGFGDQDSFYYRVQSPIMSVEFDHHSGIYLTNSDPRKYHIHTIIRTPNGNDYGRELLKLHRDLQRS